MLQPVTVNWVTENPAVSIPTTKTVRTPTSSYTVYCMKVKDGERTWIVEKRFSAFESFRDLLDPVPGAAVSLFPSKSLFEQRFDPAVIERRRVRLEAFMKAVLGDSQCRLSTAVRQFLAAPPPRPVVVVPRSASEPVSGPFPSESLNPPSYQQHASRRMSRSDDDPPPPAGGLIPENNNPFALPLPPPGMRIPDRVLLSGREQSYLFPLLDSARENLGFISGVKVSIDSTPAEQVQDRVNIVESQQSRINTTIVSLKSAIYQLQQVLVQPPIARAETLSLFLITALSAMENAVAFSERLLTMEDLFGALSSESESNVKIPEGGAQSFAAALAEEAQVHTAIARSRQDANDSGPTPPQEEQQPLNSASDHLPTAPVGFIQLPPGMAPPAGYRAVGQHPQLTPAQAYDHPPSYQTVAGEPPHNAGQPVQHYPHPVQYGQNAAMYPPTEPLPYPKPGQPLQEAFFQPAHPAQFGPPAAAAAGGAPSAPPTASAVPVATGLEQTVPSAPFEATEPEPTDMERAMASKVEARVAELADEVEDMVARVTQACSRESATMILQEFVQQKHIVRLQLDDLNKANLRSSAAAAEAVRKCNSLLRYIDDCLERLKGIPDDFDRLALNRITQLEDVVCALVEEVTSTDGDDARQVKQLKNRIDGVTKQINAFRATINVNLKGSSDKAQRTRLVNKLEDLQENMADVRHTFDKKCNLEENLAREALVKAQVKLAERTNRAIENDLFGL